MRPKGKIMDFNNPSGLAFMDISEEKYRVYVFSGDVSVRIDQPLKLHVSENDHRIFDAHGSSHYVPKGWVHLHWKVKPGSPNYSF